MTTKTKKMSKKQAMASAKNLAASLLQKVIDDDSGLKDEPQEVQDAVKELLLKLRN